MGFGGGAPGWLQNLRILGLEWSQPPETEQFSLRDIQCCLQFGTYFLNSMHFGPGGRHVLRQRGRCPVLLFSIRDTLTRETAVDWEKRKTISHAVVRKAEVKRSRRHNKLAPEASQCRQRTASLFPYLLKMLTAKSRMRFNQTINRNKFFESEVPFLGG